MTTEELKMIMDTISTLGNNATTAGIVFLVGYFLVPIVKYSIMGVTIYGTVKTITSLFVVEKNNA